MAAKAVAAERLLIDRLLDPVDFREPMAKAAEVRVRSKESAEIGKVRVTNRTGNSILVRKTGRGFAVTACCLEETGM